MGEEGLPYSKLELVQDINEEGEEDIKVEALEGM
jgi:hypothetical protein